MERASAASAGPGEGHTATTQTESAADKEWGDLSRGTEAEAPGASLRGDSQGLGYLDKSKIDRVVKKHAHKVESCYLQGLEQSVEPFGGKLSVKFTIDVDGRVTSAEARESSLGNSGVEECIVEHFLMWRFPEPEGDGVVTVTYPFVFTPGRMRPQRARMDDSTRASAVELFSVARPGPGSSSPLRPSRTRYLERRGKVRFVYDLTDDTNRLRQECYLELFGGEALAGPFEPGPSAVDIELPLDQLGYYSTYDPNEGASTLGCWIVRDGRVSRKHAYLYEVTLPRPPRPEDSP